MGQTGAEAECGLRKKHSTIKVAGKEPVIAGAPGQYGWFWFECASEFLDKSQMNVRVSFIVQ